MNIWSWVVVCNAMTPYCMITMMGNCDIRDGGFSANNSTSTWEACLDSAIVCKSVGGCSILESRSSWASRTAVGVLTPGCAKIDGTLLVDGRRGGAMKDTDGRCDTEEEWRREDTGIEGCNELIVLGEKEPPICGGSLELRYPKGGGPDSDGSLSEVIVSVLVSGTLRSKELASPSSISESTSKGFSLSTFIAEATHRSAMFVTAFSFASNSRWAKFRSLPSVGGSLVWS